MKNNKNYQKSSWKYIRAFFILFWTRPQWPMLQHAPNFYLVRKNTNIGTIQKQPLNIGNEMVSQFNYELKSNSITNQLYL